MTAAISRGRDSSLRSCALERAKVKICGLTNPEDARMAMEFGADFLGFVNAEASPRYLTPDEISAIIAEVDPLVPTVMVTHSQDVTEILDNFEAAGADILQLHAPLQLDYYAQIKERAALVIANVSIDSSLKKIDDRLKSRVCKISQEADYLLFDTKFGSEIGGTGRTYDWSIAAQLKEQSRAPIIVAGGLNPANVAQAIKEVRPYGVDVSSGVESAVGKKDPRMVREFIRAVKSFSGR